MPFHCFSYSLCYVRCCMGVVQNNHGRTSSAILVAFSDYNIIDTANNKIYVLQFYTVLF